ncbi:AMIN domain-containing protein [Nostoc sp. 'Lobaria pulmonaria (5183) cyanobiont']|uniref:AMIN domain-containing protein n=1 Tax=Nostoc sp. 'Lobaria pulmonaria (5183) cyanobiont' TaxID=1618022 RepID=UPI001F4584F0|nr:AMIN domain-containing protein [Nostoc sp. 'Lobaria pulmonaria (5183) cyanobiont']
MVTLGTNPTRSEEISTKEFQKRTPANNPITNYSQQVSLLSKIQPVKSTAEIRQVNKIERPIPNAQILVQTPTPTTPAQKIVQVTGVKANPTDKGVEVILQTSLGEQLQITNHSAVNSFIVDIPNA